MCRLLICNQKAISVLGMELYNLLWQLEASLGGHGNGVAGMYKGHITIRKGVAFTCDDAFEFMHKKPWSWFLFHTRLASAGGVSDSNCHPFRYGRTVLAMNGTESAFTPLGDALGGKTDTEAMLVVYKRLGLKLPDNLANHNSAFIGFHNGAPFAVCGKTADLEVWEKDGALVIASELPYEWGDVQECKPGFVWKGGKIDKGMLRPKTYYWKGQKWSKFDWYYDYNRSVSTSTSTKVVKQATANITPGMEVVISSPITTGKTGKVEKTDGSGYALVAVGQNQIWFDEKYLTPLTKGGSK